MLVGGCNFAQLTAWALYFDPAALQAVHCFAEKWKLTLWLYVNISDTYYNLYLTFYFNTLKITIIPSACPSVNIASFLYLFYKVV